MGLGKTVQSVSMLGFLQVKMRYKFFADWLVDCYIIECNSKQTLDCNILETLTFSSLIITECSTDPRAISCCCTVIHVVKLGQRI